MVSDEAKHCEISKYLSNSLPQKIKQLLMNSNSSLYLMSDRVQFYLFSIQI